MHKIWLAHGTKYASQNFYFKAISIIFGLRYARSRNSPSEFFSRPQILNVIWVGYDHMVVKVLEHSKTPSVSSGTMWYDKPFQYSSATQLHAIIEWGPQKCFKCRWLHVGMKYMKSVAFHYKWYTFHTYSWSSTFEIFFWPKYLMECNCVA